LLSKKIRILEALIIKGITLLKTIKVGEKVKIYKKFIHKDN
jgi:hypothetical protein